MVHQFIINFNISHVALLLLQSLLCKFVLKVAKHCFCLGIVFKVNICHFGYIVFSLFG